MIRITDMTLSCIAAFRPSAGPLKKLHALLAVLGSDYIEMPAEVYETIRPVSPDKIVLRIGTPDEAALYPEITRFVCRMNGLLSSPGITREIQMNDVKELSFFGPGDGSQNVRVVGLDDILCHDYESAFQKLQSRVRGRVEFCPENSYSCATAAALEWIAAGGADLAASFGGLDGKAALEEVLLALRIVRRHRPTASYEILPQIALAVEEITGVRFPDRKAVIGRSIFNVESGIHVDGILKKPQMYEPFMPELVGRKRRLIVGKHSGRKSIAAKLRELGYASAEFDVARLLSAVRAESVGKMTSLTDEEFKEIAEKHRL
ncbi:homocitrate synthase NifV [Sporobacter termitidis DSM 10068]|uniref:Homocitrate synthase NifV n=1 Tax=Sporobacter termitidis DSM 10068 TaxID=1123282 RepID=A0A1M5XJ06_9FIRM|nr:hypothetical protein [Sporobacter termitidis]SHH99791.1 homocitrate synthase NifV [Sporobacter termitidis DSM 10068]